LDTNTTNGSGPRAGRREWIGLAVLALPILLLSLDLSVLYLALPHLSADLGASSTQQLWIVDIYGFMIAGLLVTMGTLGDRIGRRKLLLIGASAFGGPSVAAAFSTSAEMLIATRALLGIAGATLMPSTLALISNMFTDPGQRATAIGVWASCFAAGAAIGPIIGGVLLVFLWWGSVFLLGVPVMLLLLVTAPLLLPEYRDTHAGRLDLTSVALSLAAILPVIYGLKELAKDGIETLPIVAMVAGAAFGIVFVLRQRRLTSPLLDLRLFGSRSFSAALGIMLSARSPWVGSSYLSLCTCRWSKGSHRCRRGYG
jgi:DHA2 family multidrug resistance protein-like MFS transporter